ncbi:HEAT repeat domain-containing protein, partial [bacterium]|nr:HEAT repeat domain-containing protein [bacterium]
MTPARADEIDRLAEVLRLEDTRARADRFAEFIAPDAPRPVRLRAIAALGSVGDPESADLLLLYLRDEDEDIAVAAARALGNVWDPPRLAKIGIGPDGRALDELEALFAGSFAFVRKPPGPPRVRAAAIDAFGRIATPERAVSLVRALRDAMLAPPFSGANVATASIFAIMRANPPGG